jgi:hypothetical protein
VTNPRRARSPLLPLVLDDLHAGLSTLEQDVERLPVALLNVEDAVRALLVESSEVGQRVDRAYHAYGDEIRCPARAFGTSHGDPEPLIPKCQLHGTPRARLVAPDSYEVTSCASPAESKRKRRASTS